MRRTAFALAVSAAVPLLAGCPEKKAPVVDAAPPPPPPVEDAAPTVLVPMTDDDAGVDAGVDAGKKLGPAVNTNVARLKQCCTALATQAKTMGNSPEGGLVAAAATQCTTLATQAGPSGNAPELGTLKTILAGRNIPAICAGF